MALISCNNLWWLLSHLLFLPRQAPLLHWCRKNLIRLDMIRSFPSQLLLQLMRMIKWRYGWVWTLTTFTKWFWNVIIFRMGWTSKYIVSRIGKARFILYSQQLHPLVLIFLYMESSKPAQLVLLTKYLHQSISFNFTMETQQMQSLQTLYLRNQSSSATSQCSRITVCNWLSSSLLLSLALSTSSSTIL